MAAFFSNATGNCLENVATPITAYPFTIGCWVMPAVTDNVIGVWENTDTGVADSSWWLIQLTTPTWVFRSQAAGGSTVTAAAGTPVVGRWAFIVCRAISASNRRISALNPDGSAAHGQNTTSSTPSNIDTFRIGQAEASSYDGLIGEFWFTNTDIQEDGAQLQDATLRQLAYGGPFSIPHIAKDIIEYRSLRKYPSSDGDDLSEVYHGALGRQTWANVSGATIGPHPPLPYWYEKPEQYRRELVI